MQGDNRAFSEPDLRLDPRNIPAAARSTGLRPRYVVALYDYNPRHMSPNPNGARDELSFRKGQVILVKRLACSQKGYMKIETYLFSRSTTNKMPTDSSTVN